MKKMVITIETYQRTTVRSRKTSGPVWCEQCASEDPNKTDGNLKTDDRSFEKRRGARLPSFGLAVSTGEKTNMALVCKKRKGDEK
ncbi:MAG: hypothetical protein WBD22_09120 [Pyrinomonadaceae bacterium]